LATIPALIIGMIVANVLRPGEGVDMSALSAKGADQLSSITGNIAVVQHHSHWDTLVNMIPTSVVDAMAKVQSHTTSHPASISQVAAQAALADSEADVRRMAAKFAERREVIVEGIGSLPGVTLVPPAGAFYVYPNVAGLFGREIGGRMVRSGQDVAEALLAAARIAVVPGEAFGTTHHVRLSFACSMSRIREGIARLQAALA